MKPFHFTTGTDTVLLGRYERLNDGRLRVKLAHSKSVLIGVLDSQDDTWTFTLSKDSPSFPGSVFVGQFNP